MARKHEELPHSHLLQVACLIVFSFVWFLDSFIFGFLTFLTSFISLTIRIALALFLLVLGFVMASLGHRLLFNEKIPGLVSTGVFGHIRHPMYLGYILAYLGCIVGTMSLLSLIPWVLIIYVYAKLADYEELKLEERYGKDYLEYKGRVPKWIPR